MKRILLPKSVLAALLTVGTIVPAFAADVDVPRTITADETWTAGNTYFISGYTFVLAPAVLTIEPGTVIMGREKGGGAEAAALVITAGAQIMASGTASNPIIFTSELDDLDGNLGPGDNQLWGGLVILGDATINSRANGADPGDPAQDQVEGFSVTGDEVDYITFGGTDDEDNSGVLRYVSIRHGGDLIGTANEINGLTLGGVGSGTTIEFIEVFANFDDGIEFFGGTVNVRNAVTAFGLDDGFDYDQGWRGKGQFWVNICRFDPGDPNNGDLAADKGGEWDGATSPIDATPLGGGMVANATFIGNGAGGVANTAFNIRDNAGAVVYNSVIVDYDTGLLLEADNQDRWDAGDVMFQNNIWWSSNAANNNAAGLSTGSAFDVTSVWTNAAFANQIADPLLNGISRAADGGLDPRPASNSPAVTSDVADLSADDWFVQVDYAGAFAPNGPTWMQGWTKLSTEGYLTQVAADTELSNISTRCFVGTGDSVAIPGFVVVGNAPKTVLIRAIGTDGIGPGTIFNVAGTLDDPMIELNDQANSVIATNDNWGENANVGEIRAAMAQVFAFGVPEGSNDAMLLVTLEPGAYTVVTNGAGGSEGVVIVEVWAVD